MSHARTLLISNACCITALSCSDDGTALSELCKNQAHGSCAPVQAWAASPGQQGQQGPCVIAQLSCEVLRISQVRYTNALKGPCIKATCRPPAQCLPSDRQQASKVRASRHV